MKHTRLASVLKPMRRTLHWLIPLLCALAGSAAAQPASTLQTSFTIELTNLEDETSFTVSGELFWSEPNLRIESSGLYTEESIIVLVDLDAATAVALYPDTLNGYRAEPPLDREVGHYVVLRRLLSEGEFETPADWTVKQLPDKKRGSETLRGERITHPDGQSIELWRDARGDPVLLKGIRGNWYAEVTINSLSRGAELDPQLFQIPEGYLISEYEGDLGSDLLSL